MAFGSRWRLMQGGPTTLPLRQVTWVRGVSASEFFCGSRCILDEIMDHGSEWKLILYNASCISLSLLYRNVLVLLIVVSWCHIVGKTECVSNMREARYHFLDRHILLPNRGNLKHHETRTTHDIHWDHKQKIVAFQDHGALQMCLNPIFQMINRES